MKIFSHRTVPTKVPACTVAKIMKYPIAMVLQHFSVDVEARVTKLSNLLCQKFNTVYRVTEYYGLVNLQLYGKRNYMHESHIIVFKVTEHIDVCKYKLDIRKNQTLEKRVLRQ
jgi:hypothetical protein